MHTMLSIAGLCLFLLAGANDSCSGQYCQETLEAVNLLQTGFEVRSQNATDAGPKLIKHMAYYHTEEALATERAIQTTHAFFDAFNSWSRNPSTSRNSWADLFAEDIVSYDPVGAEPVRGKQAVIDFHSSPMEMRIEPANISSDGKQAAVFFESGDSSKAYQFMTFNSDAQIETMRYFHSGDPESTIHKRTMAGVQNLLTAMNAKSPSRATLANLLAPEIHIEDPVGVILERSAFVDILMDVAQEQMSEFQNVVISKDGVSVALFWQLTGPDGASGLIHEHQWQ